MNCPFCNAEIQESQKFCEQCGEKIINEKNNSIDHDQIDNNQNENSKIKEYENSIDLQDDTGKIVNFEEKNQSHPHQEERFSHLKNRGNQIRIIGSLILLMIIFFLPIKMGDSVNKNIPIIGYAEQIAGDYCDKTFKKAAATYASAKITDKVISTIKETRMQITPMGLGLTIAPAEWLSAANDAIERVCTLLFAITGIMLTGKLIIGMISFACIKCLLPIAIISYLIWILSNRSLPQAKSLYLLLAKFSIAAWLFFPVTALVNNYVETSFINKKYESVFNEVEDKNKKIELLGGDLQKSIAHLQSDLYLETLPASAIGLKKEMGDIRRADWEDPDDSLVLENNEEAEKTSPSETKGFGGFIKEKLSNAWNSTAEFFTKNITERASKLLALADETADDLFHIFIMFCLTTIIIPLVMIILMKSFLNSLIGDYKNVKKLVDTDFLKTLVSTKKERAEKEGRKICPYCKYTTKPHYKGNICPSCGRKFEIRCPNHECNEILREGFLARFCSSCGEKLTRCPKCLVMQSATARNCSECGTKLI